MIAILLIALVLMCVIIYYMVKTGGNDPNRKPKPRQLPQQKPKPEPASQRMKEVEPPVEFETPETAAPAAPKDGFGDLDAPAAPDPVEEPEAGNVDDDFIFVSASPLNRKFYADLRNIENLKEQNKINILKTALAFNIIDREDYAKLLALKPGAATEEGSDNPAPEPPIDDLGDEAPQKVTLPAGTAAPAASSARPDMKEILRLKKEMLDAARERQDQARQEAPAPAAPEVQASTPPTDPAPAPAPAPTPAPATPAPAPATPAPAPATPAPTPDHAPAPVSAPASDSKLENDPFDGFEERRFSGLDEDLFGPVPENQSPQPDPEADRADVPPLPEKAEPSLFTDVPVEKEHPLDVRENAAEKTPAPKRRVKVIVLSDFDNDDWGDF